MSGASKASDAGQSMVIGVAGIAAHIEKRNPRWAKLLVGRGSEGGVATRSHKTGISTRERRTCVQWS